MKCKIFPNAFTLQTAFAKNWPQTRPQPAWYTPCWKWSLEPIHLIAYCSPSYKTKSRKTRENVAQPHKILWSRACSSIDRVWIVWFRIWEILRPVSGLWTMVTVRVVILFCVRVLLAEMSGYWSILCRTGHKKVFTFSISILPNHFSQVSHTY